MKPTKTDRCRKLGGQGYMSGKGDLENIVLYDIHVREG